MLNELDFAAALKLPLEIFTNAFVAPHNIHPLSVWLALLQNEDILKIVFSGNTNGEINTSKITSDITPQVI